MEAHSSTSTLGAEITKDSITTLTDIDLSQLPPIFVLSAHIDLDELHDIEQKLGDLGGTLTYDPAEAKLFLGNVGHKRRAMLELRQLGVWTKPVEEATNNGAVAEEGDANRRKIRRRNRDSDIKSGSRRDAESSTESDGSGSPLRKENERFSADEASQSFSSLQIEPTLGISDRDDVVQVINLPWYHETLEAGRICPIKPYLVLEAQRVDKPASQEAPESDKARGVTQSARQQSSPGCDAVSRQHVARPDILKRAEAEVIPEERRPRPLGSTPRWYNRHSNPRRTRGANAPTLVRQSTSDMSPEHDLPEMPDWVKRGSTFSCERSTPPDPPNDPFVEKLKTIRHVRELEGDEVGVRAYSTAIAAIAAYPYTIRSSREVLQLPGCETKIAALWSEWKQNDGFVEEAHRGQTDERIKILGQFYEIWGVGARTARDFFAKGWQDLDDIVEYGWNELNRVQQIGLKFYDEFQTKIPRTEVEAIERVVFEHAQRVREPKGVRTCIVGGYRRGKLESGDADIILTHVDESQTLYIVEDVVKSLVNDGWITHELRTSLQGTRRGQATLPFRFGGGGHGFDTLDKSMVVWQDQNWEGKESAPEGAKNPSIHRRVDIIVAPWSKIGCAVLGWSGGTTFQRDIRRYARKVKGWKFDSSGVRDRSTGEEVDLQAGDAPCTSCEEAEKRVFAGFGLTYREPRERWTG